MTYVGTVLVNQVVWVSPAESRSRQKRMTDGMQKSYLKSWQIFSCFLITVIKEFRNLSLLSVHLSVHTLSFIPDHSECFISNDRLAM